MKILLVDQFSGLTPRWLQQHPTTFEALCKELVQMPPGWREAQVLDVEESYCPPMATSTFRAGADGMAEVWKCRWDTSG